MSDRQILVFSFSFSFLGPSLKMKNQVEALYLKYVLLFSLIFNNFCLIVYLLTLLLIVIIDQVKLTSFKLEIFLNLFLLLLNQVSEVTTYSSVQFIQWIKFLSFAVVFQTSR